MSTIPNGDFGSHITEARTNARATETATPWPWAKQPRAAQQLAMSLVCYVSPDDHNLNRTDFLKTVVSRIQDDLEEGTQ